MSVHPVPGGARVSRRALVDIVRPAVLGSYGVTGLVARGPAERLLGLLRVAEPGIRISFAEGLAIELELTVAYGLPVAEVARQADSAVRYAIRRATGREIDRLAIHVGGMRYASSSPAGPAPVVGGPNDGSTADAGSGAARVGVGAGSARSGPDGGA